MDHKTIPAARISTSDVAVDGLFAGIGAGIAMAAWLAGLEVLRGESIITTLGRFSPDVQQPSAVTGGLAHLAVAALYGLLFALASRAVLRGRLRRIPLWLAGPAYGLALWGLATAVLLPAAHAVMLEVPAGTFLSAHLVYGLVLGALLERIG